MILKKTMSTREKYISISPKRSPALGSMVYETARRLRVRDTARMSFWGWLTSCARPRANACVAGLSRWFPAPWTFIGETGLRTREPMSHIHELIRRDLPLGVEWLGCVRGHASALVLLRVLCRAHDKSWVSAPLYRSPRLSIDPPSAKRPMTP